MQVCVSVLYFVGCMFVVRTSTDACQRWSHATMRSVTIFLFLTSHNILYFQLQFVFSVSYSVLILFIIVDLDTFYFC